MIHIRSSNDHTFCRSFDELEKFDPFGSIIELAVIDYGQDPLSFRLQYDRIANASNCTVCRINYFNSNIDNRCGEALRMNRTISTTC